MPNAARALDHQHAAAPIGESRQEYRLDEAGPDALHREAAAGDVGDGDPQCLDGVRLPVVGDQPHFVNVVPVRVGGGVEVGRRAERQDARRGDLQRS